MNDVSFAEPALDAPRRRIIPVFAGVGVAVIRTMTFTLDLLLRPFLRLIVFLLRLAVLGNVLLCGFGIYSRDYHGVIMTAWFLIASMMLLGLAARAMRR